MRVACRDDVPAKLLGAYGKGWAAREKAVLNILRPQPGAEASDADLLIVSPAELPRWAAAGKLQPVPHSLMARGSGYVWESLLPDYGDKLVIWDSTAYALPLLGQAPLCFYRSDLFDDPRHQRAFEQKFGRKLAPPATWEEFADLAEYFLTEREPGKPAPSLPPLPEADDLLDQEFYTVAAPFARRAVAEDAEQKTPRGEFFSFHYDLETGKPRVQTPGFLHALKLLQRLQKCRSHGTAAEPPQAFLEGRAVLCLAEASWITRFQKHPDLRGKFRFVAVPGSSGTFNYQTGEREAVTRPNVVPYLGAGGWLAAVVQGSPNTAAAFAFLAELTGPQMSRQIVIEPEWGGGAFRIEHFDRPEGWSGFGLDQAQTTHLVASLRRTLEHRGTKNPVLRLRTPDQHLYQQAMVSALRSALTSNEDAGKALAGVAQRWQELDAGKTRRQVLDDYLLSLSLQPPR